MLKYFEFKEESIIKYEFFLFFWLNLFFVCLNFGDGYIFIVIVNVCYF